MANAFIHIYDNGEERSLDTLSSEEFVEVLAGILKLVDNKYSVDLYTSYVYDIDSEFILKFGLNDDKYAIQTKMGDFEVAFEIQEDSDNDSEDSYS